ncbi:NnrS family protein [Thiomicrorhabdus arctica]|uniref:NnrS family protein n=1 Tax=Thiomicrorhabdus arctica TaxID=131540 RepID=UPI00035D7028|nr:NnrS family protein [Thiomicrorhabdus arctica]
MSILNLDTHKKKPSAFSLFNLGFRPFFLGAGLFAMLGMLIWFFLLQGLLSLPLDNLSVTQWHAHEMIFGFTMAVAAGFLLTAVKNWTGVNTPSGRPLAILFSLWIGGRIGWFLPILFPGFGFELLLITALLDLLFNLYFAIAFATPIFRAKQWKQNDLLAKIILMGLFNIIFYLGLFGILEQGMAWGNTGGFFIILALIMTMGRRVIPFFIEKGVKETVSLANPKWIDYSNLGLLLLLMLSELFLDNAVITAFIALMLFFVGNMRLINWYTPGIWAKPMLWSLYLGMVFIQIGFLLYVITAFQPTFHSLAIHSLAVGGIGLITLAMMTRVSLGHTGRNVNQPPKHHTMILSLVVLATLVRVVLPMIAPEQYGLWMISAQFLWILAFALFCWSFIPMLVQKRVDGHFG